MATAVVLCGLPLCRPHLLSVSVLCLPHLNCSHQVCISLSPLLIHLVSLQSSPDRTSLVDIRTWLQSFLNIYQSFFSCWDLVSNLCEVSNHLQPVCFTPSSLKLPTLQPALCLTPGLLQIIIVITPTPVLSLCSALGSSSYRTLTGREVRGLMHHTGPLKEL